MNLEFLVITAKDPFELDKNRELCSQSIRVKFAYLTIKKYEKTVV